MQDGYTQVGCGASDMRVSGQDLQHNRQTRTADEAPSRVRMVTQSSENGGPMKHHIEQEANRHNEARQMRLQDLERHYKR